jgi:hypothetical protein
MTNSKQIFKIDESVSKDLIIEMNLKVESLDEIVINANPITVEIILEKVFKNFKKNHFVEPIYYKFYSRLVYYQKDSTLNAIEEYAGTILQNKMHNTRYNIEKGRIKYFAKDSIEQLENHRVISMDKMYTDNIFKFREDYIKRKRSKRYQYKLVGKSNLFGRDCYVLTFYTERGTYYKKGELYIDIKDFAVIRKVLKDSNNQILNDIIFKKDNKKWYLTKTENYHNGFLSPDITDYRITIYNHLSSIKNSNLDFIRLTPRDFSIDLSGDFNDKFWENNNFVPLPNWIKKQIN